jgi:putative ATPase
MLEAGDDPLFVSRRMVIFASEDVGNADPRALMVAVAADEAVRRVGMPEAHYALAQASVYLACAPKSNAAGRAWQRAKEAIAARGSLPVPKKLRNAPTPLMREEGYGGGYRYPHDAPGGFLEDERYLPDGLGDAVFYEPTDRGEEEPLKGALEARRTARSRR